jgi:hypothetical protein
MAVKNMGRVCKKGKASGPVLYIGRLKSNVDFFSGFLYHNHAADIEELLPDRACLMDRLPSEIMEQRFQRIFSFKRRLPMGKKTCLLALVVALAFTALAPGQSVESMLDQAMRQYKAGAYQKTIDLLFETLSLINKEMPLQISHLCLCDRVDGHRNYKAKPGFTLAHGEPFLLYFEVEGFNTLKDGNKYWVSLAQDVQVVDNQGKQVFGKKNWVVLKNDYDLPVVPVYFTNRLTGMDSGTFTVTITLKDEYKKQTIQKVFDFTVQ